jgi:molybdopterin converting factor small subunit
MSVIVRVPAQLRSLTQGLVEVPVEGGTVGEVLQALDATYPGFAARLFDDEGRIRRFVNLFLVDQDVRFLQGLDTSVDQGQTISIVPAVAGG